MCTYNHMEELSQAHRSSPRDQGNVVNYWRSRRRSEVSQSQSCCLARVRAHITPPHMIQYPAPQHKIATQKRKNLLFSCVREVKYQGNYHYETVIMTSNPWPDKQAKDPDQITPHHHSFHIYASNERRAQRWKHIWLNQPEMRFSRASRGLRCLCVMMLISLINVWIFNFRHCEYWGELGSNAYLMSMYVLIWEEAM